MAANSIGASKAEAATSRALEAHRTQQDKLRQEAAAIQERSRTSYDGFGAQQEQRAAELGSYLQQKSAQPAAAPVEATPGASNITVQEVDKQRNKARTFAQGQAGALGEMRGFGDLLGTLSRDQARDAGQIGQLGGFMKGNSSVLPVSLDAASQAGAGWQAAGALAGGLGKLGVSAGLSGMLGAGGAAAGGSIPALAGGSAPGSFDLGSVLSKMPAAPMTIGTKAASLPSFARAGNLYSVY